MTKQQSEERDRMMYGSTDLLRDEEGKLMLEFYIPEPDDRGFLRRNRQLLALYADYQYLTDHPEKADPSIMDNVVAVLMEYAVYEKGLYSAEQIEEVIFDMAKTEYEAVFQAIMSGMKTKDEGEAVGEVTSGVPLESQSTSEDT